jgi:acid stress-induced BolA-like protein IbaG/YrbA
MIYGSVTELFANLVHVKRRKLVFPAWMRYIGAPKFRSILSTPLYPKCCLGMFRRCKTSVSSLNALFRGTKVAKHPFYSIGPKMMYGSVAEHFYNLFHVKRWKLVCSGLNALFRGTNVAKDPFYSIRPKMMFRSVSEHFDVKRCKTCVSGMCALFRAVKLWSIHSSTLHPKLYMGVLLSTSLTFGM